MGFGVNLIGASALIADMERAKARWGVSGSNVWIVGVGAEYGIYLEFGTSRMPAYPFLVPAVLHVSRTKIPRLEKRASSLNEFVSLIALEIEREAKKNASGRPGPRVQTGFLKSSIQAFPADALSKPSGATRSSLSEF